MKDFNLLVENISTTHKQLQQQAVNSINQALTIRNWLIGYYIVEFEQNGLDRAEYGTNLITKLAKELNDFKGIDVRSLHNFRLFYRLYPQIETFLFENRKVGSLNALLPSILIRESLTTISEGSLKVGSLTALSQNLDNRVVGGFIITKLSYTHLEQLIRIEDDLKRTFYEIECIKGTWSVRELKRQIASLYYERTGLSAKPEKLSKIVQEKTFAQKTTDIIKNIYAFELKNLS